MQIVYNILSISVILLLIIFNRCERSNDDKDIFIRDDKYKPVTELKQADKDNFRIKIVTDTLIVEKYVKAEPLKADTIYFCDTLRQYKASLVDDNINIEFLATTTTLIDPKIKYTLVRPTTLIYPKTRHIYIGAAVGHSNKLRESNFSLQVAVQKNKNLVAYSYDPIVKMHRVSYFYRIFSY